ncbi:PREDICTED: uncharacterized protein LOC108767783 [Trachymyrmex cornetzi]|uniref:uncharacterized protein LOC108767783 n=1 Tax=Trachymyrmex cornetzi TaxID=471704 RepID=UPI00084F61DE|nr:PREDICTED: uncharacterized protein LOC108767783 [Trachymyrmex cornetzi]
MGFCRRRSSWDLEAEENHIMGFCLRRGSSRDFIIEDHRRISLQKRTIVKDHHRILSQKGPSREIAEDHRGTLLQKRIIVGLCCRRGSYHGTLVEKNLWNFVVEEEHRGTLS